MLLGLPLIFTSCDGFKEKKNNPADFTMRLLSNSPVNFDEPLKVQVVNLYEDFTYEMVLPGGIYGASSSFETEHAHMSHQGWYKVTAYGSDNFMRTDSVYVEVVPAVIPCSHPVNKLSSNTNVSLDFYGVGGRVNSLDQYEVSCNAIGGDLDFSFGGTAKPVDGTYISAFSSGFNSADEVSADMVVSGGVGVLYHGSKGQWVHVSNSNGVMAITLCDFKMSSQYGNIIVNARVELN